MQFPPTNLWLWIRADVMPLGAAADPMHHAPTSLWLWGGLVAGGLMLFAVATVIHTLAAGSGRRPSFGQTLSWAGSFLWALPVLAVASLVVARTAPRFEDPSVPQQTAASSSIQVNVEDPEGLSLEGARSATDVAPQPSERQRGKAARTVRTAVANAVESVTGKKPEIQSTSPLPEWISKPETTENGRTLVVVASAERSTKADAEEEARTLAAARVRREFEKDNPTRIDWTVPESAIRFNLVYDEQVQRKAGNASFTMHRAYRQLEINDETRDAAYKAWRAEIVTDRLQGLAAVLGMGVLTVAAGAVYLRLDHRTQGTRRTRLKAATTAAITAGGLVLAALV